MFNRCCIIIPMSKSFSDWQSLARRDRHNGKRKHALSRLGFVALMKASIIASATTCRHAVPEFRRNTLRAAFQRVLLNFAPIRRVANTTRSGIANAR